MLAAPGLLALAILSFKSPRWGLLALFVITSTLFNLDQYFCLTLPVGYLQPMEIIVGFSVLGTLHSQRGLVYGKSPMALAAQGSSDYNSHIEGRIISILSPYCTWQTICVGIGCLYWAGTPYTRFGLRFLLGGVLPFALVWVIWRLGKEARLLFRHVVILMFVTSVAHLAMQLGNIRGLYASAYYSAPGEYVAVYENRMEQIVSDEVSRSLPQGFLLILCLSIYYFSKILMNRKLAGKDLLLAAVFFFSTAVGVVRSALMTQILSLIFVAYIIKFYRLPKANRMRRLAIMLAFILTIAGCVSIARPQFVSLWEERLALLFTGNDAKILSEDNAARGRDNIAALQALGESPLVGWGTPRYPEKYSIREDLPTDIHPLLQVGMIGGVPAIVLVIALQFRFILEALRMQKSVLKIKCAVAPFCVVLMTIMLVINTIGAGGMLSGNAMPAMTLFMGAMLVEIQSAGMEETYGQPKSTDVQGRVLGM